MPSQASMNAFVERVAHGRNVHYLHVSAISLFIYDYATTLSAEASLIWPAPWGAGKVLFLLTRYLALPEFLVITYMEFFATEPATCHSIFVYIIWSAVVNTTISELILIIRTWAIWNGWRALFVALLAVLLVLTATLAYHMALYTRESVFVRPPAVSTAIPACFLNSTSRRIGMAWLSWTAFELVIVLLTVVKAIQHFKLGLSNLMMALYRDGIFFFIFMFLVSQANLTIVYTTDSESYIILLALMQRAIHATLSCRILLNLKAARAREARRRRLEETSSETIGVQV